MAVRSLGQLTLDLVARVGGFTGPMDQASRAAKKDMADIAKSFKGAATAITATAGTVAAAGGAIVALTKTAADNARTLQNQAQVANASVEEFQRMAYATQSVQIEQDKLSQILQDVNDRVGDFMQSGGGEMADFFENIAPQVGVTADQFRNLSGPQALQLYYDSLERANLSQQDMTFYLEAIASDTTALIPLLRDGGQGFADMAAEADELGIVLSELDIAKLNEFGRQFDRVNGILATTGQLIAAELSPYLSTIGDDLVELAADGDGFGESVRNAVESSLEVIGYLSNALHGIEVVMKGMRAAAFSVGQAYTAVFAEITDAATFLMDQVAGAINTVIDGINHIPGVDDIPLISSFQNSGYAQGIRALRDEMAGLGEDARQEFVEAFNEPLPKTVIDEWLSQVRSSTDELEADIALPGMTVTGSALPNAKEREAAQKAQAAAAKEAAQAAKEAAREIERQRDAYRGLLDELYPLQASQREFREEMELLDLAAKAGEVDDLADAQRRLREASAEQVASGMEDAPDYAGLDGSVGGAFGEIAKIDEAQEALESWYETQLEMLAEFREARADLNSEWDEREQEIQQQHQDQLLKIEHARQQAQLVAAESVFGDLADVTRTFAGEQSGIYKAMFAVQKAAAIAQSLVAIQQGIAMAAANPFPYNLAAMASVASATAGIVSNIASIAGPDGMAHEGINSVPEDGTWYLKKGERVTTADTSAKLDRTLDDVQRNRSDGGGTTVNVIEDASRAGQVNERQDADGKNVIDVVVADIAGDGKIHKAISSKYALSTKGR
ncbi:hypothetical protein [Halomonas litopenaei]|uniref:hypothetical protein n=1 Tax=Halomonas litopenaei TaxID=2109328 RepID=UPI001A908FBB|nr:hypothetical protein [Halomonas litopenaei]MBN8410689.1 hypothetical protein [Halomonas litopenaei]